MDSAGNAETKRTGFQIIASDDDFGAGVKRCGTCGDEKPLVEFSVDRSTADGRKSQCKACKSKYDRNRKTPKVSNDMIMVALERAAYRIIKESL